MILDSGALSFATYGSPNAGTVHVTFTAGSVISISTIYHIVLTYNGVNTGLLYVNGAPIGVSYSTAGGYTNMSDLNFPVTLGAHFTGSVPPNTAYFDGVLDEVAMYNKVLTPTEILAHYNAGI